MKFWIHRTGRAKPAMVSRLQAGAKLRRASVTRAASSASVTTGVSSEVDILKACSVRTIPDDTPVLLASTWTPEADKLTLLVFFTHWADLGSWELAQQLADNEHYFDQAGEEIIGVGLGSAKAGELFKRSTRFAGKLFADPVSQCHKALGFSPGFLPDAEVNGYLKIFPMLAGIGSPGTMQEVLRGYMGDRSAGSIYQENTMLGDAFNVLGRGYQRPFELATQRLMNMVGSLSNWSDLAPEDTQQLVQQGGSLLLKGSEVVFRHDDTGILMTTKMDDLKAAVDVHRPKAIVPVN